MDEEIFEKEFQDMTRDEREKLIRELIHSDAASVKAAFLNPKSGETLDIHQMVDKLGEEKVVEMFMAMTDDVNVRPISMDTSDIDTLIKKKINGTITEDEAMILNAIQDSIMQENPLQMQSHMLEDLIGLVDIAQNKIHYQPTLADIFSAINVFVHADLTKDKSLATNKFENSSADTLIEISSQIGLDILNTWKDSCSEEVDDSLVIMGLLHLLVELSVKNGYKVVPVEAIAQILGFSEKEEESENETENGSNESDKIIPITKKKATTNDKKMRNMLKDD